MNQGLVIIPTYNEIENIESIIRAIFALDKVFHVLIVDDNSPDKTFEKVADLHTEFFGKETQKIRFRDGLCSWV
jgi:dolichol-phosphate mannosyltransferase